MKHHVPRGRALLALASLATLTALVAGCVAAPATTPEPARSQAAPTPAPSATQASAVTQPATAAAPPAKAAAGQPTVELSKLPVGVDADGNFYRGDPKATVRLQDFSDFQ